jgi:23S rRNA pseudouridine2605 synthase
MTKAVGGQKEQKQITGILRYAQNDKQKSEQQIPSGDDKALRAVLDASRKEDEHEQPKGERLQKILAAAGIASRRKAEEIILAGRVQVNGTVVKELGTKHDASRDHIRVDGKLLKGPEVRRYYMLNKPRGYVTTLDDPQKRPTVMDLMMKPKSGPHGDRVRLYPVGRLDYLSEGLLLMTNDGELANSLSKAAAGVEKTYLVKVSGVPEAAGLEQIRRGIVIDRGRLDEVRAGRRDRIVTAPARVELVRAGDNPWYEVTLTEGRNRQLRKMFEEDWPPCGEDPADRVWCAGGWTFRRASSAS